MILWLSVVNGYKQLNDQKKIKRSLEILLVGK